MLYIINVLLGLIPEVLFFTLYLTYIKNLKDKHFLLFILITIAYILCITIQSFKLLYYLLFIGLIYVILKLLYKKKTQIIDIFVIMFLFFYVSVVSYLFFVFLKEDKIYLYYFYILDRILLFSPLIFRNKFNIIYKKYCKLWNRNDKEKRPIKSITLRNISLIVINFIIAFMNIYILLLI